MRETTDDMLAAARSAEKVTDRSSANQEAQRFALSGSTLDFIKGPGPDLMTKARALHRWHKKRIDQGYDSYARALAQPPETSTELLMEHGRRESGINFSSQNHLSLTLHPRIIDASHAGNRRFWRSQRRQHGPRWKNDYWRDPQASAGSVSWISTPLAALRTSGGGIKPPQRSNKRNRILSQIEPVRSTRMF